MRYESAKYVKLELISRLCIPIHFIEEDGAVMFWSPKLDVEIWWYDDKFWIDGFLHLDVDEVVETIEASCACV